MAATQTESDRRNTTRISLSIPSKAKLNGHADKIDYQEMVTRDISNRGAFFETASPFPLASELRLILDMGKLLVRAIGSVVRVDTEGMAVAFIRTEVAAVRT